MKDIIIVCALAAVIVFGYFAVKKLDAFLTKNSRDTDERIKANQLLLAFDNPMIIDSLKSIFEKYSKENPDCHIHLMFGTVKEISDMLASNDIDFGFIAANTYSDDKKYKSVCLSLNQCELSSKESDLSITPLSADKIQVFALWNNDEQGNCKKSFADLLESFS